MIKKQLNLLLINKFPELLENYYEEVNWQEGDETGSHVVYGDVFAPYIEKTIDESNYMKLNEIFDFIEEILIQNEKYSTEVIMFSILERLISNKKYYNICEKYFGQCTKNVIKEM